MLFGRKTDGVEPREAAGRLERGEALLLDVREPAEWQAGHIPQALHIPMGELAARAEELPRDREIIAVCRSGGRSERVTRALQEAGYRAVNLDGGMKSWHGEGLPLDPPGRPRGLRRRAGLGLVS